MQIDAGTVSEQRAIARVAGALAHELNNPLQGVLSLLGVALRECRLDERCQARLEQIQEGVNRISRTVGSLSAIYENLPRSPDPVSHFELLNSLAASLSECGFRVHVQSSAVEPKIYCFAAELARLTADLILEHSVPPRDVRLSAVRHSTEMMISCEMGDARSLGLPRADWQSFDRMNGISGLAILLDELLRLSNGRVEFQWRDSDLIGLRLWMNCA